MTEDDVLAFVRQSIKSVWALELLLLLRRDPQRVWTAEELIRELRSSTAAVGEAVASLRASGMAVASGNDSVHYGPATEHLGRMADDIAELYARKPLAVARAIMNAPNDKLRIFADSFRLKGE